MKGVNIGKKRSVSGMDDKKRGKYRVLINTDKLLKLNIPISISCFITICCLDKPSMLIYEFRFVLKFYHKAAQS